MCFLKMGGYFKINLMTIIPNPYPIRGKGQSHALKLASWLAKGEVMLFGFRDYEIELYLLPK